MVKKSVRTIVRSLLKILYVFPVKRNRIIFIAFHGKAFTCNPKYIYEELVKEYGEKYEYIWVLNDKKKEDEHMRVVKNKSLGFFFYVLTSKVIVSNNGLGTYIPKRKNQMFINTWHGGGAYKRVDIADKDAVKIFSEQTDVFLSSCSKFTEVMSETLQIPKIKFLECGMPRNDLFFSTHKSIKEKVRQCYSLKSDEKLVLYAPTFRGNINAGYFENELNIEKCLDALEKRFGGKWRFAFRSHYFVNGNNAKENYIDMTNYDDMQELLYTADFFITDYSSTIWDYSLMNKPGCLFVPDIEEYAKDRNFYTDPDTWAFSLAKTNLELEKIILNYNINKGLEKIKIHQEILGIKETGRATKIVVEKIVNKLRKG